METVRRLGVALLLLTAAGLALTAQSAAPPNTRPAPPNVNPGTPHTRPQPRPSGYRPGGQGQYRLPYGVYPSVIVNYATPTPKPKHTKTPQQNNYGQDVFSTHSTEDNGK